MTKAEVSYGPGKPAEHCAICVHYRQPASCTIVEGSIDWRDWCKKFDKGKPPAK
jgi:hypothetical protein